ncbi:hypothetical protein AKUA1404_09290 [Apilactobacillus kunkeei]|nr:hypothetical protein AKUA1404_09290 [Apilactobacillus kunkeei]
MKVYVIVIKKEQNDNEAYIYGVYSTKEKAVEEAHSLPPCFVHISEFELDSGDTMINSLLRDIETLNTDNGE